MTMRRATRRMLAWVVEPKADVPLSALLEIMADHPWEVRATFSDPYGSITWIWAREVLEAVASGRQSGYGDVRMWADREDLMVRIETGTPAMAGNAYCIMALPRSGVRYLMECAAEFVPYSAARAVTDDDLRALLDTGA